MHSSVLSVSQLNFYVKSLLDESRPLKDLYIRGEISNFTRNMKSGHCYFTLKDDESSVRAVMFTRYADEMKFEPGSGMEVLVRCSAGIYQREGQFQLTVFEMQPQGLGGVYLAVQQLKERLQKEGLFDDEHKKSLPLYPRKIGVITSTGAAAYTDILTVLSRRWPMAEVIVSKTSVQGSGAATEMTKALKAIDRYGDCDVLILGRGGGSVEDLWEFNSEELARAVYACETPIVSAVGHERDYTICDLCADLRAPTPSAAAELSTPDIREIMQWLDGMSIKLTESVNMYISMHKQRILLQKSKVYAGSPQKILDKNRQTVHNLIQLFTVASGRTFERKAHALELVRRQLSGLNPLEILSRGYSVTCDEQGKPVSDASQLAPGQSITTRLGHGKIVSTVTALQIDD